MDPAGIPVPGGAIGRPGLVAQLRRVKPDNEGRLVLVQRASGPMSSLSDRPRPVFAWQVLLLGDRVDIEGKRCREVVVADASLRPVCQLESAEARDLIERRAREDLQLGLDELHRLLSKVPPGGDAPSGSNFADAQRAEQSDAAQLQSLLAVQPVPRSLRALDFRRRGADDDAGWHWSGHHEGVELNVSAGPVMFGHWQLTGRKIGRRDLMWSETMMLETEPFGAVALKVLNFWREAFGAAVTPPLHLGPALVYEQHLEDMRPLRVALPTLWVDGEVVGAVRRWLRQRRLRAEVGEVSAEATLDLDFSDGMLRLTADHQSYGCTALGGWPDHCRVSLRDFLALPPCALRGANLRLEQSATDVIVNGYPVRRNTG